MKAMSNNPADSKHAGTASLISANIMRCVLMCMIHVMVLVTTGQVTIHLHLPPPGQFTPEDFIEAVSYTNSSGMAYAAQLHATLEEDQAGLIFSGNSSVFVLEPGYSTPHYTVY